MQNNEILLLKDISRKSILLFLFVLLPLPFFSFYASIPFATYLYYVGFASFLVFFYLLFNNKKIRKIYFISICVCIILIDLLEIAHVLIEENIFDATALKIFLETNTKELAEYCYDFVPWWGAVVAVGLLIVVIKLLSSIQHYTYDFSKKINRLLPIGISLLLALPYIKAGLQSKYYWAGSLRNEVLAYHQLQNYYTELEKNEVEKKYQFSKLHISQATKNKQQTYVLIIGESTSKHHMGLYGYFRNTNPRLSKRKDINVFTDVISSKSSTIESLSQALTLADTTHKLQDFSCINIIDVAKKMGLKTYWLSNQAPSGFVDNSISVVAKSANYTYFTEEHLPKSQQFSFTIFDELLFAPLQNALQDTATSKLIIVHLMGAHTMYKNRFPDKYKIFTNTDTLKTKFKYANTTTKLQMINDYDNCLLYNDFVLDSIFTILQNYKNTSAIYFADHADEVYDNRDALAHDPYNVTPYLCEIPFITWHVQAPVSDTLLCTRPLQLNNLAYSLLGWMGISDSVSEVDKNIFNPTYIAPMRYINGEVYKPSGW